MSIPGFAHFLRPVLELVAEKGNIESARKSLLMPLIQKMGFTDEDASERLPSGGSRLASRCGWALTYLTKAGLVEFANRGHASITSAGREFLQIHAGTIKVSDLDRFPSFVEFRRTVKEGSDQEATIEGPISLVEENDPEQRIESAIAEIRFALTSELLQALATCDPTYFEVVILDLMAAMGYSGKSSRLEHTGKGGDAGIDGIVHIDRLGFEKIYIQAKRWKGKVGRPDVQAFFGALAGKKARKGVMMTTSKFTPEAKDFAQTVSDTLILVDGETMAGLMIDHGVGVNTTRSFVIPTLDSDYFE